MYKVVVVQYWLSAFFEIVSKLYSANIVCSQFLEEIISCATMLWCSIECATVYIIYILHCSPCWVYVACCGFIVTVACMCAGTHCMHVGIVIWDAKLGAASASVVYTMLTPALYWGEPKLAPWPHRSYIRENCCTYMYVYMYVRVYLWLYVIHVLIITHVHVCKLTR